jgi:glucuronyl esterase-like protein
MRHQTYSVALVALSWAAALGLSCSSDGNDGSATPSYGPSGLPSDGSSGGNAPGSSGSPGGAAAPGNAGSPGTDGSGVSNGSGEQVGVDGISGIDSSGSGDPSGSGAGSDGSGEGGALPGLPEGGGAVPVEDGGTDCPVAALPEPAQLPRQDRFPDPFTKLDGTRLTQTSEWRCRRQEILQQAEKYIYGQKPPRPESVTGSVTADTVSVEVQHEGKSIQFSAQVLLPPGQGPFPAIINLGTRDSGITLGEDFVLQQGVAIIFYNHYDLGQEGEPEASRGLPNPGAFYDLYGGDHSAGLLMSWAWGASRLMDVLQESGAGIIDSNRVGVTGCSRNGKGAFTVGVFDERIALTIPQETSTGGLPAYRMVDVLAGAERTNYNFFGLNWLSNDFAPFVENASQLPIDSHEMVAMVAPRGLLVLDNPHIAQFAATAAHTAVLAGAEVFRALGVADNVSYVSDVVNDQHCAPSKPEYDQPLRDSIGKFLKNEGAPPATMRPGATGTGDLSQWRDWQTPTLQSVVTN